MGKGEEWLGQEEEEGKKDSHNGEIKGEQRQEEMEKNGDRERIVRSAWTLDDIYKKSGKGLYESRYIKNEDTVLNKRRKEPHLTTASFPASPHHVAMHHGVFLPLHAPVRRSSGLRGGEWGASHGNQRGMSGWLVRLLIRGCKPWRVDYSDSLYCICSSFCFVFLAS